MPKNCEKCGKLVEWVKDTDSSGRWIPDGTWNDGRTKYKATRKCGCEPIKPSGYEQAVTNSTIERYKGVIIEDIKESAKAGFIEALDDCGVTNKANNKMIMEMARNVTTIDANTKDIVKALEVKGKLDYRKDGSVETLEDQIKQNTKDITGLYDLFGKFTGYTEALLMKQGFPSASEYMKKTEEQSQIVSN